MKLVIHKRGLLFWGSSAYDVLMKNELSKFFEKENWINKLRTYRR